MYETSNKNWFWSIKNSGEVLNKLKCRGFRATSLSTYDFSTLYTTLPHNLIKDVVWDIFVFALGNTPGFHLIRAKVCSVFKLKFALNIPYYVYLFLETRHTISRCHIATHFDLKACPSTCLNLFVVTKCLKHTLGYHDTDITIYMHQQTQKANMAKEVFV